MSTESQQPATAREPLRKAGDSDLHPSALHGEASALHLGGSTSDAISTAKGDKSVTLEIELPKTLRKSVRKEAKRRGVSVDQVVIEALQARTVR